MYLPTNIYNLLMYHNYSFLSSLKLDKGCIINVTWYNKCSCVHVVTIFILVISYVTLNYNYKNMLYLLKIKKTFSDWRMGYYRIVFYFPIIWIAIIVVALFQHSKTSLIDMNAAARIPDLVFQIQFIIFSYFKLYIFFILINTCAAILYITYWLL